jgi:hypothetical protein
VLAAVSGVLTFWLEPRLAREQPRRVSAGGSDTAQYWAGSASSAAGHSTSVASVTSVTSVTSVDAAWHWPTAFEWVAVDAGVEESAPSVDAHVDVHAEDAAHDDTNDVAVDHEDVTQAPLLVAVIDSAPLGPAPLSDPNVPTIVPLYVSVPIPNSPVADTKPTLGGTAIGAAGAGGIPATGLALGAGFPTGYGAGGGFTPAANAAGGASAFGGTRVGATTFGIAGGLPFGATTHLGLFSPQVLAPFDGPVTFVLTPYGWFVVPAR